MSDYPDPLKKVTDTSDLLGKLRNFVSGFIGYVERDQRREADKIMRETVAQRYEEQWSEVSRLQQQLIDAGKLELVDDLERAAIKLRTFADRVKGASYGYAGIFDHVRIREEELAKLYAYDVMLLENVEAIGRAVDNVETSMGDEGLPAAIRHLETLARQAIDAYNRREEVILQVEQN
jgi:hypothetical protein